MQKMETHFPGSIQILPTGGPDLTLFSVFLLPKLSEEGRSQLAGAAERCQEPHPCTSTAPSPCSPLSTSITFLSIESLGKLVPQVNHRDSQQRCYAGKHDGGSSSGSVPSSPLYSCQIAHKVRRGSTASLPTQM